MDGSWLRDLDLGVIAVCYSYTLYTLDESEETGQEAGGVLAGICSIQCKHNKYHRTAALERGTVKTFSKLLTVTITGIWAADALYGIFVTL